jgi:dTMP kinase
MVNERTQPFEEYIEEAHRHNIKFEYLWNAITLGGMEWDPEFQQKIHAESRKLVDAGVDSFTVTNPLLSIKFKQWFPDLTITSSVNNHLDSLEKVEQLIGYAKIDRIMLDTRQNRNVRLIKTTQIDHLSGSLRDKGREVVVTRQPTDWYRNDKHIREFLKEGIGSKNIRSIALFAAADRLIHVADVIEPALQRGAVVICDRYVFSTIALFVHRGVDLNFILQINKGVRRPDYAIYLDVPTRTLLDRLKKRDGEKLKFEERSAAVIDEIKGEFAKMGDFLSFVDGAAAPDIIAKTIRQICGGLFNEKR